MKTKKYRVGPQGAYRDGILYANGSLIEIPDDDKPENQPSNTWIPISGEEAKLDTGAFTNAERAENPNPLPPTPATSKSFLSQGQHIPKGENEKTVGELKAEAKKGAPTPASGSAEKSATDARKAAEHAEHEAKKHKADKTP